MYMFIGWSLALCAQIIMYGITPPAWRNMALQAEALSAAEGIVGLIMQTKPSDDEYSMMDVMAGVSIYSSCRVMH